MAEGAFTQQEDALIDPEAGQPLTGDLVGCSIGAPRSLSTSASSRMLIVVEVGWHNPTKRSRRWQVGTWVAGVATFIFWRT